MKSVELKKGWLFKIAKIGGLSCYSEVYGVSICEYNQCILKGALTIIFCSIIALFVSYGIISPIVYGIAYVFEYNDILQFMQKHIEFVDAFIALDFVILICGVISFVISLFYDSNYYYQQRYNKALKEPSAIALHWRAFKDKICFTVNFKENT